MNPIGRSRRARSPRRVRATQDGAARKAPGATDLPPGNLAVARELLDRLRLDSKQLGHLLEREHVRLVGAECVVPEDHTAVVLGLDRHAPPVLVEGA